MNNYNIINAANIAIGTTETTNAALVVKGNIKMKGTGTALPPASADYRGAFYLLKGSGTDPDRLYMCMMKSDQSTYQWVLIARGD